MKAHKNEDSHETRIALLEQSIAHINETLIRLETKIDINSRDLNSKLESNFQILDAKLESNFQILDAKLESNFQILDTKIDSKFTWVLGLVIFQYIWVATGFGSLLYVIAKAVHWLS